MHRHDARCGQRKWGGVGSGSIAVSRQVAIEEHNTGANRRKAKGERETSGKSARLSVIWDVCVCMSAVLHVKERPRIPMGVNDDGGVFFLKKSYLRVSASHVHKALDLNASLGSSSRRLLLCYLNAYVCLLACLLACLPWTTHLCSPASNPDRRSMPAAPGSQPLRDQHRPSSVPGGLHRGRLRKRVWPVHSAVRKW